MSFNKHNQLLGWINQKIRETGAMKKKQVDTLCNIVVKNELVWSDLDSFADAQEMTDGLEMDKTTAEQFWDIIQKEKNKHVSSQKKTGNDDNENIQGALVSNLDKESVSKDNNSSGTHDEKEEVKVNIEKNKKETTSTKLIGGKIGFNNLGNTCFLNSALQCLLHTPGFTHELVDEIERMRKDHQAKQEAKKSQVVNNNQDVTTSHGSPTDWRDRLKQGAYVIWRFGNTAYGQICQVTKMCKDNSMVLSYRIDRDDPRIHYWDPNTSDNCTDAGCGNSKLRKQAAFKSFSLSSSSNSMYGEWLHIIKLCHLDPRLSLYRPENLHRLIRARIPELGNYQQNDSCQAFASILKEIENDLPNKKKTDLIFEYEVAKSFNDEKYDSSEMDSQIIESAQEIGALNLNANFVSKYFDGIEVTQNICMGCGNHKRIFSLKRITQVPIVTSYGTLTIFQCYHEQGQYGYNRLLNKCIVPSDCTPSLAKFYALKENERSACERIITDYSLALVSKELKYCGILEDGVQLAALAAVKNNAKFGLFVIKNDFVKTKKATSSADMASYAKALCLQIIPDGLKKLKQFGTSVLMNCLLFDKKHVGGGNRISTKDLKAYLKKEKLGFFARGGGTFKNYDLVFYVNGQYVSSGGKDGYLSLHPNNVIVCLWQFKAEKKIESYRNNSDELVKAMRSQLCVETKGKSLDFKLSHAQNEKLVLQRKRQSIASKTEEKDQGLSIGDQGSDEFFPCSKEAFNNALEAIDKQIGVCDDFIQLMQSKIDPPNVSIAKGIKNGVNSLFEQCKISNKHGCICFVSNERLASISQCIKLYENELFRESQNYPVVCSQCKGGVSPILSIRTNMVQGPKILMIKFDRGMNNSSTKYSHVIDFDLDLSFAGVKYDLFAINCHSGSSGFGHYTAYVKQLGTNNWLFCNDSTVSPKGKMYTRNLPCKNAQFIMYRRKD